MNTDKRFLDRYDDLLPLVARAIPERPVDLLIYSPHELEQLSCRRFIQTILSEGKAIYESAKGLARGKQVAAYSPRRPQGCQRVV
ncbi:MAG: hypothetical protein QHH07_09575 [Sedimentisphaerales bacterium]|jgi:hypothetical protein|nr:hypothetical protein [Sedimentisphaerales bacterium]